MKSGFAVTFIALVTVLAVARLLFFYGNQPAPGEPIPHRMPVACTGCEKAYIDTVGAQPAKCHYCRQQTLWRAQKCYSTECGEIFPVIREDGETVSDLPRCTRCGSDRIGQVSPDEVSEPED